MQDAARFYRQLACKLQTAYGAVGFSLEEAQLQTAPAVPDQQYTPQDCKPSVYRCLICLGDIFRCATHHSRPSVLIIPALALAARRICQTASLPAALSWLCSHCICVRRLTNFTCMFDGHIWSCRYETSVLQSQPKKDWSAAAKHYRLAMSVYPSGDTCHPSSLQPLFCCVLTLLLDAVIFMLQYIVVGRVFCI